MADFSQDLFIFEIANNHQGDLDHGLRIIERLGKIAQRRNIRAALKFQLRQLDSFIDPKYGKPDANKHIPRFRETRLDPERFAKLAIAAKSAGLLPMSTIFDEASIPIFQDLEFSILKIGSCSARDYPLLRALSKLNVPTILSTASLSLEEIEKAVWYLRASPKTLAIMHCVGLYPTQNKNLLMRRIQAIQNYFPGHATGFSTHEGPEERLPIQLAVALGATIFEKHVGLATEKYKLNGYSADPEQVEQWIDAYFAAKECLTFEEQAPQVHSLEKETLRELTRGVYAAAAIKSGDPLDAKNTRFAIPLRRDQVSVNDLEFAPQWRGASVPPGEPLSLGDCEIASANISEVALRIYTRLTLHAQLPLKEGHRGEISCHHGLEGLAEAGALLVTMVNSEVCKKYLILLPGQAHPEHRHADREEFMRLVAGDVVVKKNGQSLNCAKNDFLQIERNSWHSFASANGGVLEEITTRYGGQPSEYRDSNCRREKRPVEWRDNRWNWK